LKVFITGVGCITPIGHNKHQNIESLKESKSGLKKPTIFQSKYASDFIFGEVDMDNATLMSMIDTNGLTGLTRTDLLALIAFEEAIIDAGLSIEEISSNRTAFISASTVGGMCLTNQLYDDSNLKSNTTEFLESYSGSAHTLQICKKHHIKGLVNVINTACSSSANAIAYGARLIKSGRAKRAIVGGVDSLSKYTVNGFNSLQILSNGKCTPFDENRKGLNLGEAAGYIVLESEEVIANKMIYARVAGYGNSNDAYHASSMSDDATGITIAINKALESAGISSADIDYINAHGTGTQNNDLVELTAFKTIFERVPPFSSTKSFIGHTLGAAGVVEAIYSVFSLMKGDFYPNLNFKTPIGGLNLRPITDVMHHENVRYVMSNSYGFSGNCTSLILEKA
jgi:3-oxoacyl-(acyl-carrier-protein) synthase